ncbi:MAG: hypothetical protein K9M75_04050 [Phycisphaerae bacterium]|nr:hypothetical protein [Phycisphaerae bacterium]
MPGNIQKHAKAGNVMVDVSREDDIIVIIVEDDGIGFDASERLSLISKDSGFGLFSIRERLSYFKGSLKYSIKPRGRKQGNFKGAFEKR